MATSEAEGKGKRPAAPYPLSTMPPAKRANTGDSISQVPHKATAPVVVVPTLPQEISASALMQRGGGSSPASRMQLSRYQAVEKCIPSIAEQVIASTDLRWFANSLVEKELIGAQPKSNILQAIGVSDARKVVQLMKSVVVQIKNHPAKYTRFLGVLKEQPVLASLADSIKAVEKTLRTQPTERQATRRPSTGTPELGTPPAPKLVTDKPRTKGKRCGECRGCLAQSDCGKCINCKDKKKFGGPGTGNYRKKCIHRQCVTKGGDQPHPPAANDNQVQFSPVMKPTSNATMPTSPIGIARTIITPQVVGTAPVQVGTIMLATTQPHAPQNVASATMAIPTEQRRAEHTTSCATTPNVLGPNIASTVPQEQVQMLPKQPSSIVRRSSSTSPNDGGKRVRFNTSHGKAEPHASSGTTAVIVPQPKAMIQVQTRPTPQPSTSSNIPRRSNPTPRHEFVPYTRPQPKSQTQGKVYVKTSTPQPQIHVPQAQSAPARSYDIAQPKVSANPTGFPYTQQPPVHVSPQQLASATREGTGNTSQGKPEVTTSASGKTSLTIRVGSADTKGVSQEKVRTDTATNQQRVQVIPKRSFSTSSVDSRPQVEGFTPQRKYSKPTLPMDTLSCLQQLSTSSGGKLVSKKADKVAQLCQERDNALREKHECQSEVERLNHDKSLLQKQVLFKEKELQRQAAASKTMEERFLRQLQDREKAAGKMKEEYETRLTSLSRECSKQKLEAKSASDRNTHLQVQVQLSSEQLMKTQRQLQAKEQEQAELAPTRKATEQQLQWLQKQLREQAAASEAKEGKLHKQLQDQERVAKEKEEEYEARLRHLSSECSKQTSEAEVAHSHSRQIQEKLHQKSEALSECQRKLHKNEQELSQQATKWKATQQQLQQKARELQQSVSRKEEECQRYQEEERASKEKKDQTEEGLKVLTGEYSTLKATATQLQAQVREYHKQILSKEKELREQAAASKAMEERLQRQVDDQETVSREKEEEHERQLRESAAWSSQVGGVEGVIEQLQLQLVQSDEQLMKTQQQLREKNDETEEALKLHSDECSTLKDTVTSLEEQLKQKNKQLQSVVSYCEGQQTHLQQQLQSKIQELASAQTKEQQLAQENDRLRQSVVEREKEQTQEAAFKAKELRYKQQINSRFQQYYAANAEATRVQQELASAQDKGMEMREEVQRLQKTVSAREKEVQQAQMQAHKIQKQVQQRDLAIVGFYQQWKELQYKEELDDNLVPKDSSCKLTELVQRTSTIMLSGCSYPQLVTWEKEGLRIHVPAGALKESEECIMVLTTGFLDKVHLPADTELVSGVFQIESSVAFHKPVTLEIEHGCDLASPGGSKLMFAKSTAKAPPYTFEIVQEGEFPSDTSYGRLEVSHFSLYSIIQRLGWGDSRQYRGHVFYQKMTPKNWKLVLVVTRKLEQCLENTRKCYYSGNWAEHTSFDLRFGDNSEELRLDVDQEGVQIDGEGWKVFPIVTPLRIRREDVNSHRPGSYDPPNCQLSVEWFHTAEPKVFRYTMPLVGIQSPNSVRITLDSASPGPTPVTSRAVLIDRSLTEDDLRGLMDLLHEVRAKWQLIGTQLKITQGTLDTIGQESNSDCSTALRELLVEWMKKIEPPSTVTALTAALSSPAVSEEALAGRVETKYSRSQ